jgi:hypothetical protein
VDEWEWDAKHSADTLRDIANDEAVDGKQIESELRELAAALDEISNFRHTFGSGAEFSEANNRVGALAKKILDEHISPVPFSRESEAAVHGIIVKSARKLKDLWRRAEAEPFGNLVPEAQKASGEIGRQFVEFSFYDLAVLRGEPRDQIREIGERLFKLEAQTIYYDGGDSQRRAIAEGLSCSAALANVVARIAPNAG